MHASAVASASANSSDMQPSPIPAAAFAAAAVVAAISGVAENGGDGGGIGAGCGSGSGEEEGVGLQGAAAAVATEAPAGAQGEDGQDGILHVPPAAALHSEAVPTWCNFSKSARYSNSLCKIARADFLRGLTRTSHVARPSLLSQGGGGGEETRIPYEDGMARETCAKALNVLCNISSSAAG